MVKKIFYKFIILAFIFTVCLPKIAVAYVGPGVGLSAIGAFLALLAGIVVWILGFLWYPIKRLFGKKPQEPDQNKEKEE